MRRTLGYGPFLKQSFFERCDVLIASDPPCGNGGHPTVTEH